MWPSSWRPAERAAPPRCLARLLAWAPIAWGSLVAGPALAADTGPATLLLALRLNGIEQERPVEALRRGTGLALPQEVWRALRLKPDAATVTLHDGQAFQTIDSANGTRWRIDEQSQTLVIDAPAGAFVGGRNPLAADTAPVTSAPGFGGYANYDLQWQRSDLGSASSRSGANALIELGGFGSAGSLRSTGLVRSGNGNDSSPGTGWTRLDTTWTLDRPEHMTRLRLGDAVSHPGAWGRSLRFAGLQWSTDFALRPGFLSFPLPSLQGEAVLPSTVDLYVNNSRRLQGQVPAGAFDLTELPVVTGQGELRMVVRDLLGREQVIVKPYYTHPWMLRPGLNARALDIGFVREDYGLASHHYGRLLASFSDQLGITEHFTRELRAEALGDQASAGASGMWLLPAFGSLQVSAVGSHGPAGKGALFAIGTERHARDWNGSLQVRGASRGFTQIGQPAGSAPRLNIATAWGSSWGGSGVGISLVAQRPWQGATQRLLAFNLAHSLGPFGTLSVFALRDLVGGSTTLALSLTQALDDRSSAGATGTRHHEGGKTRGFDTLQLQRNLPDGPGFGYQLAADRGDAERYTAQGAWQTEQALFNAGLARSRGSDDARLGASGGLAWLGDSVFLSRRIEGSFAVVEVGGYPNVQLLHDNRPVARTDAQGRALVSGLRAHEPNRIGVDAADLPFDAEVFALDALLTPPARSGVALRLAVERVRAASFRLVGPDGRALPAGGRVTIVGQAREFPVGFDGRSFVTGLSAQTTLLTRWPGHECHAPLTLPDELDEVPDLGTLVCR